MNAKKLKLLKVSAVVIIIFLISALVMTYMRMADVEEELKLGKIKNNNTSFVVYGDEKFFFSSEIIDGKPSFKLINKNEETDTVKVIQDYANTYADSEILAKDNKIYYYTGIDTYVYDIATGKITLFAQGKMQYLTDEWYITLHEGTLYKGIYYHNTMNTKERYPLTSDGEVQYAYQDDTNLYFVARTSKNYYALMGLNKTDLTITVYDTVQGYEEGFIEVATNKDYVFSLINVVNDPHEYRLRIISKANKKEKWDVKLEKDAYSYVLLDGDDILDNKLLDDNIFMLRFKKDDLGKINQDGYMRYNISSEKTTIEKVELNDLCVYEYSAKASDDELVIYKNNKVLHKVELNGQKTDGVKILGVYKIEEDTYYKVMIDSKKKIFIYVKVDVENNVKIY